MESELKKEYDDMGIEASDEAIAKSIDLCISYHIEDAAEFVEQWIAFSVSNLNGAEPTIDYLLEFERKVLQAKRDKELAAASIKKKAKYSNAGMVSLAQLNAASAAAAAAASMTMDTNPLAMYGVGDNDVIDDFKTEIGSGAGSANEDDVCRTPKAKGALPRTPARHNDALFSPASFSPIGTPRTHMAAAGSGKIVYTFGNPSLISSAQWNAQQQPKINIKQLLQHNGETLNSQKGKYMFDCLMEKAELASDSLFNIGQSLCRKVFGAEAQDYDLSQVDVHSQGIVKAIGRICCEHDGPLDASSTLLIDSDEMRLRTVRLNFSKTKSVGVFPGQVVMVSGMNPKGDVFMVDEIISERNLEPPQPPKFADQLSFVIAAGPYTHDDDLVYDPLQDLLGYLKDHKPNVLILIGPFMEADHKLISETTTLAETFESFFEKMLAGIVNIVGTSTTILVLTSHRDANADPVYPTMPLQLQQTYPNVQILPDPSLIDLNGIIIGMTSTDIVDHIHSNELAVNAGDKVKRIVNYLLNQGSFYPLQPPVEDRMCYDSNLASKFANLDCIPNILLLPSEQKCFIRVVNGCLAINPGRLAASSGGTFARFIITPPEPKNETSLFNYVGCQIRKV